MTELIDVEPVRHATPKRRGLLVTVVVLVLAWLRKVNNQIALEAS